MSKNKTLIRLTPNENSSYGRRNSDETHYEYVELGHTGHKTPWGMVHVDLFYNAQTKDDESELYQRLLRGDEVVVELTIHEEE